jgi:hypothetical protein
MTINLASPHDWLPTRVRSALAEAELRVLAAPSYERAWERVFTAEEREQIGDLRAYCRDQSL